MTFRFYAQLNDFLPAQRRQRRFTHVLAGPASVKDAIEALGVPHPEVDVILVNGESQDFGYRVGPDDDVSIYPVFRTLDVAGLRRTSGDPPHPIRFVVDAHLGKLASLLRLCGFDALLLTDDAAVAQAAGEGRVALTRDIGLLKRSIVVHGYWVRHTDPELQLAEVLDRYGLAARLDPFARCLRCNTPVVAVAAGTVADRLPPRTRACFVRFRECPGCGRVYWEGSHYSRLARVIERVRERLVRGTGA